MENLNAEKFKLEFEEIKNRHLNELFEFKTKIENYYNISSLDELSKNKIDEIIRAIYAQLQIICISDDELEIREDEETDELRKYLQKFFTNLEIETIKYIAQDLKTTEIVQIYKNRNLKATNCGIERRKERILEKIHKYFPQMIISGKTILTIKMLAYSFHLLNEEENNLRSRLQSFIKMNLNE